LELVENITGVCSLFWLTVYFAIKSVGRPKTHGALDTVDPPVSHRAGKKLSY